MIFVEGMNLGDLLKFEAPNLYSRDQVTVAPNQTLVLGQVVGALTASGQIVALNPAAADGSEQAIGIVLAAITTLATASPNGLLLAREAAVSDHALVWPAAITPAQQAAAIAQLKAHGILVREGR